jgi:hypothetical protein
MDTVSSNKTFVSETTPEIDIDVQTQAMSYRTSEQIKKIPVCCTPPCHME